MTQDERKKIYAALAAPFPEQCIQRTEGRITGRGYDTAGIGYQFIVNRLNEACGLGGWRAHRTLRTKEITTAKGRPAFESIADVTIELGAWVDGNFVAYADAVADGGHVSTNEADSIKGAYTNAIKKAAAMFGCGRQAYEGTLDDDNVPTESGDEGVTVTTLPTGGTQRSSPSADGLQNGKAGAPRPQFPTPPPAPMRSRLSSKQLAAIWAIGRKLGYEQQQLRAHIKQTFGVQPEFLTRETASQVIGTLAAQAGNGHAAEPAGPGAES